MKYKKITVHQIHKENPFVERAVSEIRTVKRTETVRSLDRDALHCIVEAGTGEVSGYSMFVRYLEVDEEKFAKVYLSHFSALFDLSKPAIRILGYIFHALKPNHDFFIFDMEDALKYTKYASKPMVFSGLSDLIENDIIARAGKEYLYFINPLVFFNGDRAFFAKGIVKKKKAIDKNQLTLDLTDNEQNEQK